MGTTFDLNQYQQPNNAPVYDTYDVTLTPFDFSNGVSRNSVSATKVRSVFAGNILAGTVKVGLNLGSSSTGYILLDGANNRIIINDGTVDRVILGFLSSGFWHPVDFNIFYTYAKSLR